MSRGAGAFLGEALAGVIADKLVTVDRMKRVKRERKSGALNIEKMTKKFHKVKNNKAEKREIRVRSSL
jgi:hypothetical protein